MEEVIKIMNAKQLALKTRRQFGIFNGLVEVTIKNKDIKIKQIGKFSDAWEKVIKEEGFVNLKI